MDKTFVSVVGPGRHTRTLHFRRSQNNHFLGKLAKKLVGAGEKAGLKAVAKKNPEAAAKLQQAMKDKELGAEYQKGRAKVVKGATATLATAAILGAGALLAPAVGGAGAAGAAGGGAGAAAGGAGGVSAGTAAGGLGAVGTAASALGKNKDLPSSVKDIDLKQVEKDLKTIPTFGGASGGLTELDYKKYLDKLEKTKIGATIKGIEKNIPTDVKKQLTDLAKKSGRKLGVNDVIANGRTSPELLPKNKKLKDAEDIIASESDKKFASSPLPFDNTTLIILAVVVFLVLAMMFRKG